MRALSFDLDETLWQMDGVLEEAERLTHEYLQTHHPAIAAAYPPDSMRALRDEIANTDPSLTHDITALRIRTLEQAAHRVGASPHIAEKVFAVFMDARHRVTLYADALPTLEALHRRLPLVALTNGNADIHRLDLGHYFVTSLSAADVGVAKPERDMFESAARSTGVPMDQLMHVGDCPVSDVLGAARHGLRAVWLNRTGAPWPEHLPRVDFEEIRSLNELPGLLAR